jgi:ABC-2 type transport system ATP-binding protein
MNEGVVTATGTVPDLRERYGETEYHVYISERVDGAEPRDGEEGFVKVVDSVAAVTEVREQARARNSEVLDLRTVEPSLERVFLHLAERGAETPPASENDAATDRPVGSAPRRAEPE